MAPTSLRVRNSPRSTPLSPPPAPACVAKPAGSQVPCGCPISSATLSSTSLTTDGGRCRLRMSCRLSRVTEEAHHRIVSKHSCARIAQMDEHDALEDLPPMPRPRAGTRSPSLEITTYVQAHPSQSTRTMLLCSGAANLGTASKAQQRRSSRELEPRDGLACREHIIHRPLPSVALSNPGMAQSYTRPQDL